MKYLCNVSDIDIIALIANFFLTWIAVWCLAGRKSQSLWVCFPETTHWWKMYVLNAPFTLVKKNMQYICNELICAIHLQRAFREKMRFVLIPRWLEKCFSLHAWLFLWRPTVYQNESWSTLWEHKGTVYFSRFNTQEICSLKVCLERYWSAWNLFFGRYRVLYWNEKFGFKGHFVMLLMN